MSLDRVRNVILILSGKGGVGKSSVTAQLALALSLEGKSVGILDIDLTGPSIPRVLGIESAKISQAPGGWLPVEVHASQVLPPCPTKGLASETPTSADSPTPGTAGDADSTRSQNGVKGVAADSSPQTVGALYAVSLGFLLASRSSAVVWRGPKKTAMIRQFLSDVLWPPLDYLLIDTPPGTSDEHISVVETLLPLTRNEASIRQNGQSSSLKDARPLLAGAIVVTTPQAVAVADVRKELSFCAKTGVKVIGVVENLSGYVCPCCGEATPLFSRGGGAVMASDYSVPFLGAVPIDAQWGQLIEEGLRPVYHNPSLSAAGERGTAEPPEGSAASEVSKEGSVEAARQPDLLVDKYRNCSLRPIFAGIARQTIDSAERDAAVRLDPAR